MSYIVNIFLGKYVLSGLNTCDLSIIFFSNQTFSPIFQTLQFFFEEKKKTWIFLFQFVEKRGYSFFKACIKQIRQENWV